jgi:cytochrome c oxidase subunit 3
MTDTAVETLDITSAEWTLPSRARVGMTGLILTEASFFSIFIVAYLYYIGRSLTGPYPAQVLHPPIFITGCLLSSSLPITLAVRALQRGDARRFARWWSLTIVLGATFLGGTALEWRRLIVEESLTIRSNLFGTTFYSLVGFHALHVAVGLILLSLVLGLTLTGAVRKTHVERVEMLSWYWHFVDAVWVAVFTAVYVVGR